MNSVAEKVINFKVVLYQPIVESDEVGHVIHSFDLVRQVHDYILMQCYQIAHDPFHH